MAKNSSHLTSFSFTPFALFTLFALSYLAAPAGSCAASDEVTTKVVAVTLADPDAPADLQFTVKANDIVGSAPLILWKGNVLDTEQTLNIIKEMDSQFGTDGYQIGFVTDPDAFWPLALSKLIAAGDHKFAVRSSGAPASDAIVRVYAAGNLENTPEKIEYNGVPVDVPFMFRLAGEMKQLPKHPGLIATLEGLPSNALEELSQDEIPAEIREYVSAAALSPFSTFIKKETHEPPEPAPTIRRVQADLRSLHTAIEAYKVDNITVPPLNKSQALTTPVAYITGLFPDPFDDAKQPYRWRKKDSEMKLVIYSVGPDGLDDKGAPSSDDISREIDIPASSARPTSTDPEYMKKYEQLKKCADKLAMAVQLYYHAHNTFPPDQGVLAADGHIIQKDPFNPEINLTFQLLGDNQTLIIHSAGQDGKLDENFNWAPSPFGSRGGLNPFQPPPSNSSSGLSTQYYITPNGQPPSPGADDLAEVRTIYLPSPESTTAGYGQEFLNRQLAWERESGQQSAMTYYARMIGPLPYLPDQTMNELITNAYKNGWTQESESLRPVLRAYENHFSLVRQAAGIPCRRQFPLTSPSDSVPNFLSAQVTVKMMAANAQRMAADGQIKEALDEHLALLRMADAFQNEDAALISHLIGIALRAITARSMQTLLVNYKFPQLQLRGFAERVSVLESGRIPASTALINELRRSPKMLSESQNKEFAALTKSSPMSEENKTRLAGILRKQFAAAGAEPDSLEERVGRVLGAASLEKDYEKIIALIESHMALPVPERLAQREEFDEQFQQAVTTSNPLIAIAVPNFMEADVRDFVSIAYERLCATAALLLASEGAENKEARDQAMNTFPDPFSGKPFLLDKEAARPFQLRSVGPDLVANDGSLIYDPTNGTVSPGDLFFGKK